MPRRNSVRLTKVVVESLPLPVAGNAFVWDEEIRGFGVRVFSTGTRVFVYQCRVDGRTVRLKLGVFPSVTVDEARRLAKQAAGTHASGQPLRKPAGEDERHTVAELFPTFLAERVGKLKPRTQVEYERLWQKTLKPVFGRSAARAVDEGMVARWHSETRKTPMLANRAIDLLSGFFAWAERRGYCAKLSNPCPGVERFDEPRRSRSLSADEYRALGAVFTKAEHEGIRPAPKQQKHAVNEATKKHRPKQADQPRKASPVVIAALRFIALSGWREQEALSLRWDAIDFVRGVAVLQDTKAGRNARPLGKPALDLLRAQPRKGAHPFVFPGARAGTHLTEPKYTWTSVRHEAGLTLRLHDLRHSFTTVASDELGIHDRFIAGLIGHTISGVTARYGEIRENTLRHKADEISTVIDGYLNGVDAKVLPFVAPKASNG